MAKKKQEQEASWFEPVTGFFGGLFGAEEEEKKPAPPALAADGQPDIEGLKAVAEGGGAAAVAGAGAAVAGADKAVSAGDIEMQMPGGKDVDIDMGGGGGGVSMGGGGGGGDGELGVLAWVATGLMGFTLVCCILMMALSIVGSKFGGKTFEVKAADLIKAATPGGEKSAEGQVIFSFIIIGMAVSLFTTVLIVLQKVKGLIAPMKFPTIGLAWFSFVSIFIALMMTSVGEKALKEYVKNVGKSDGSLKYDPALYIGWIFMVIGSASSLGGAIVTTLAFLKAE